MKFVRIRLLPVFTLSLLLSLWLTGCASYSDGMQRSLQFAEQGNFQRAQSELQNTLDPDSEDALLYFLELGLISHLAGDHAESNRLFDRAERLSETLYTVSLSNSATVLMSNPRARNYQGSDYELLLINYYKALNYLSLNQPEAARVEVRRLGNRLDRMIAERGELTSDADTSRSFQQRVLGGAMDLFRVLAAGRSKDDTLLYREDAYAYWFSGLLYEMQGEWDNARVAYENAARVYEQGYAEQYNLGSEIVEQAWLDVIRVMRRAGGYESRWPVLAQQKLSEANRLTLDSDIRDTAQLVVIQHVGHIPARGELNFLLTVQPGLRSLVLQPVLSGDWEEQRAQLQWFDSLYADNNATGFVKNTLGGGLAAGLIGTQTKVIPLGPLWDNVESLGLLDVLRQGVRVTVPYYPPVKAQDAQTAVIINQQTQPPLYAATSLAELARNEQIYNAGAELQQALVREVVKLSAADKSAQWASSSLGDGWGMAVQLVGWLSANATSAAETRSWLTLPAEIRVQRYVLEPGRHALALTTSWPGTGKQTQQTKQVELQSGELALWQTRTTAGLK